MKTKCLECEGKGVKGIYNQLKYCEYCGGTGQAHINILDSCSEEQKEMILTKYKENFKDKDNDEYVMTPFEDKLTDILDTIEGTLLKKNTDYGNSFHEQRLTYGDLSTVIRLDDKMRRLKQLVQSNEVNVKDEALEDTILDIAGYAILHLVSKELEDESM